jgi:soluble lytic murein transglycosylase-like protein
MPDLPPKLAPWPQRRALLGVLVGAGLALAALGGPVSGALAASRTPRGHRLQEPATAPAGAPPAAPAQPTVAEAQHQPTATVPVSEQTASTTTPSRPPGSEQKPAVALQRTQRTTPDKPTERVRAHAPRTPLPPTPTRRAKAPSPNGVALPPQLVAGQAEAIATALAASAASTEALGFYRIPLFLLPVYKAAAARYGVPWQILAAINEVETNYGSDLSVSTAGAVGWMQFMPSTWLQYGVDALNAGYADPYNPVDAIFAAARYLRAAGAASDLRAAILAYNHSEAYVDSVLLRAKLISSYPKDVIATLTGLSTARLPITGAHVSWEADSPRASAASANPSPASLEVPTSRAARSRLPAQVAARAEAVARRLQMVVLAGAPNAAAVAVQDGRIIRLGHSRQLGRFVVLRDVYGDEFTYAALGSIARSYPRPKPPRTQLTSPARAPGRRSPARALSIGAAGRPPVTLAWKAPARRPARPSPAFASLRSPSARGKVRLYAHPGNPDALVAASGAAGATGSTDADAMLPLRRGAVVQAGTVLGRVTVPAGAHEGHIRFAIRPAGDRSTIDPRPLLASWARLAAALHPLGAKANDALLGATATDALLLSPAELERSVLSDPGVTLDPHSRQRLGAGKMDRRVLAVLVFLSRSGLKPTVSATAGPSAQGANSPVRVPSAASIDVSAIDGVPIAGHQGSGTITDLTIRALLRLRGQFAAQIVSLMRYPSAARTHASLAYWNRIRIAFSPLARAAAVRPNAAGAAHVGIAAPSSPAAPTYISASQWEQLVSRIAALPVPRVSRKPSLAAIPDPAAP